MQFILDPRTPAEARLLAAFINDYADLVELQNEQYRQESNVGVGQLAAEVLKTAAGTESTQAETPAAKKSRAKKGETAATVTEPAGSTASQTSDPAAANSTTTSTAETGNATQSANTANTAGASGSSATATAAGSDDSFDDGAATTTQADAVKVTHDDIKKLLGTLSQNGKRSDAVGVIRGYESKGYNGVSEIAEGDLYPIYAKLKAL